MGVRHHRVLVHGVPGAALAVPRLGLPGPAAPVLDDRLLQPAGLPHRHAPGGHARAQGLGAGQRGALQRDHQARPRRGDRAPSRGGLRVRTVPGGRRVGPPQLQAGGVPAQGALRADASGARLRHQRLGRQPGQREAVLVSALQETATDGPDLHLRPLPEDHSPPGPLDPARCRAPLRQQVISAPYVTKYNQLCARFVLVV